MRKSHALLGILLLTGVLAACGGGVPGYSAPDSLTLSAKVGSSVTQSVSVTNTGDTDLSYTASSDSGWLTIPSGYSGSIAVGATATLSLQGSCMAAGSSSGHITVSAAGMSKTVSVVLTCAALDTTPDPFLLLPVTNAALGSSVMSNEIVVTGLDSPAPTSVTGGSLLVNGAASSATTVVNGDKVKVQVTSSASANTATNAVLTIGGVSATFTVITGTPPAPPAPDTTPDPFIFNPLVNQALSTAVTSNEITVSGITAPAPISVSGGSLLVNGVAAAPATVSNGDKIKVQVTTAGTYSTPVNALVTIGGVSASFSAGTLAAPPPPGSTPAPMQVSATTLGFSSASGNQTVNITKANYTGALTQTNTCMGVVSVSTNSSVGPAVTMTVTPLAAGTCAITVQSGEGETATINVTVTTTSIIIN